MFASWNTRDIESYATIPMKQAPDQWRTSWRCQFQQNESPAGILPHFGFWQHRLCQRTCSSDQSKSNMICCQNLSWTPRTKLLHTAAITTTRRFNCARSIGAWRECQRLGVWFCTWLYDANWSGGGPAHCWQHLVWLQTWFKLAAACGESCRVGICIRPKRTEKPYRVRNFVHGLRVPGVGCNGAGTHFKTSNVRGFLQ